MGQEKKDIHTGKDEVKMSSFLDHMNIYFKSANESTENRTGTKK